MTAPGGHLTKLRSFKARLNHMPRNTKSSSLWSTTGTQLCTSQKASRYLLNTQGIEWPFLVHRSHKVPQGEGIASLILSTKKGIFHTHQYDGLTLTVQISLPRWALRCLAGSLLQFASSCTCICICTRKLPSATHDSVTFPGWLAVKTLLSESVLQMRKWKLSR